MPESGSKPSARPSRPEPVTTFMAARLPLMLEGVASITTGCGRFATVPEDWGSSCARTESETRTAAHAIHAGFSSPPVDCPIYLPLWLIFKSSRVYCLDASWRDVNNGSPVLGRDSSNLPAV